MGINIGTTQITEIKVGTTQVNKVITNGKVVWEKKTHNVNTDLVKTNGQYLIMYTNDANLKVKEVTNSKGFQVEGTKTKRILQYEDKQNRQYMEHLKLGSNIIYIKQ